QDKADVVQHHLFGLIVHHKRVHVPAPVPVQKGAAVQPALQQLADRCFPHAHGAAHKVQCFHLCSSSPAGPVQQKAPRRPMGREGLGAITYASAHRAKSLNDLADDAGTNGTATLTDSETQALFHSDSGQQLNAHDNVIARHAHLGALGQRDDAGHVGGAEVELRTIVGEERGVTAAFFLGQDVDLALELGVGMDGTGLSQDLAALDLGAVHATQQGADVVAGLSEVQALAEHLQTSDGGGDALGTDANDLHLIANL